MVCTNLTDPSNGRVTADGTTFLSTATYTCDHGYRLIGDNTRTCGAGGQWSSYQPRCERKYNNLIRVNAGHALQCISILSSCVANLLASIKLVIFVINSGGLQPLDPSHQWTCEHTRWHCVHECG